MVEGTLGRSLAVFELDFHVELGAMRRKTFDFDRREDRREIAVLLGYVLEVVVLGPSIIYIGVRECVDVGVWFWRGTWVWR